LGDQEDLLVARVKNELVPMMTLVIIIVMTMLKTAFVSRYAETRLVVLIDLIIVACKIISNDIILI